MVIGFAACTKQAEKPLEAQPDVIEIENVEREADKSASMWELVCRLFPDNVIFKDAAGNFTYKPVNKNLALDSYDWSSLSGTLKGIDVSYYQGDIDWAAVKNDGIKYAFIRLGYRGYTEGGLKMDVNFEKNVKGALENDIPVGVYFVTKALTEAEGVEEARYVIDNIKLYNISWPVVIDIEPTANESDRTSFLTPEQRTTSVLAFCDEVGRAGYTPMIYGGVGTYMSYLEFERLEGIEKWFAQYFNQPYLRYEFGIWQATSSGKVSGIKGDVDIDYSIKDYGAGDKK
jgi:GH25 family lysozyme M1 (1,4-beta-N-acetylmuramidase)